jgi:hypothetical protein
LSRSTIFNATFTQNQQSFHWYYKWERLHHWSVSEAQHSNCWQETCCR